MVLDAQQINSVISSLNQVLNEQTRILNDAEQIIVGDLSGAWECQAQKAYAEAFLEIKSSVLSQINQLIELFVSAFAQSQDSLYKVDVDISNMNATAFTGP